MHLVNISNKILGIFLQSFQNKDLIRKRPRHIDSILKQRDYGYFGNISKQMHFGNISKHLN